MKTHERENQPLSVLIIEDDLVARGLLTMMLAKEYRVIEAGDGKSGVGAFIRHAPDVVLLDIHLPDLTGYEVVKRLRSFDRDSYIVMLSADDADERLILAHAQDVAAFVKKPFAKETVIACIEQSRRRKDAA